MDTSLTRDLNEVHVTLFRHSLIASLALLAGVPAQAQESACGPYRVALYEYGSLAFVRGDQSLDGIDVNVLDEVARRTGCKFEKFIDSRIRTWTALANGTLDMTVSAIRTDERKQFATFVIYVRGHNRLLVRSDVARSVHSLKDFADQRQLRLAVVKGFKHGLHWDEWIDELRSQGRVDEYADANVVARLVSLGRADAFLSEPMVWSRILTSSKLEGRIVVLDAFPEDDYAAGFALSSKRIGNEERQKMQSAIDAMRADGTLYRIFRSFLPEAEALSSLP